MCPASPRTLPLARTAPGVSGFVPLVSRGRLVKVLPVRDRGTVPAYVNGMSRRPPPSGVRRELIFLSQSLSVWAGYDVYGRSVVGSPALGHIPHVSLMPFMSAFWLLDRHD